MAKMGIEVVNFNIQSFADDNHVIENLGIDNISQISKDAAIAKANADRDVTIAKSLAEEAANNSRVAANQKIIERIEWSAGVSEIIGVDIDSYNIVTMRNLVQLERKTPAQISELKKHAKLPFAIKGVFTKDDVELVKEVKPEIVVISNHGGRVENRIGSTAMFLKEYGPELKNYCGELWVDGGLRTKKDLKTASYFGVSEVMLGRPFVTALCRGGEAEVKKMVEHLRG
jgi:isopentenyl diphosphate isomerase/L-lactate dehydrogenase-like FMN-dependent dehydrogenase